MSHGLLEILRFFFLGLIWLFFLYAARMVLVEVRRARAAREDGVAVEGSGRGRPDRRAGQASRARAHVERPAGGGAGGEVSRGRPSKADAAPLRLRIVEPAERRGVAFDLGTEITLGRSPGCAVPLEGDRFASSVHARVFRRGSETFVEDLGSTNGTYLNGERVAMPVRLRRGDRLKVGNTLLEVSR
jgi:hypothetical protein